MPAFKKANRPDILKTIKIFSAPRADTLLEAVTAILCAHKSHEDVFILTPSQPDDAVEHNKLIVGDGEVTGDPVAAGEFMQNIMDDCNDQTFVVGGRMAVIGYVLVLFDKQHAVRKVFYKIADVPSKTTH